MVKTIVISILLGLSSPTVFARDITKPYSHTSENVVIETDNKLTLQGIHKTELGKKALINGIWYKEGENFAGIKVLRILKKSVIIIYNGEKVVINL